MPELQKLTTHPLTPPAETAPKPELREQTLAQKRLDALKHPIYQVDLDGKTVSCNNAGDKFAQQITPEFLEDTVSNEQLFYIDQRLHKPVVTSIDENSQRQFVLELVDIHDDYIDPITGLPNSAYLHAEQQRLRRDKRNVKTVTVLVCDLVGLKITNDSLGHAAGNEALLATAKAIQSQLRGNDTACRSGGDEITVNLESDGQEIPYPRLIREILERPHIKELLANNLEELQLNLSEESFLADEIQEPISRIRQELERQYSKVQDIDTILEELEEKILDFKYDQAIKITQRIHDTIARTTFGDQDTQLIVSIGYGVAVRNPDGTLDLESATKWADDNCYLDKRFHYLFEDPEHSPHKS